MNRPSNGAATPARIRNGRSGDEPTPGGANGSSESGLGVFPLREFLHDEAFGGILLLACAIAALAWANSPWNDAYDRLWHAKLAIGTDRLHLDLSLQHWVNDGLMALFFVVVGLEIKRELLVGELASPRRAALPAIAALGGVLAPAAIYAALNVGTKGADGWGIPMATDIAFALGVLALLGERVPVALKVFLTALAIVDDIAAVLVIAFFYTGAVSWSALGIAGLFFVGLVVANRLHVRWLPVYGVLGLGLWAAVHESGIHATIAGVLLALTIPARTRIDPDVFVARGRAILDEFDRAGEHGTTILTNGPRQDALAELEDAVEGVGAPLQRLEHALHPWVAFVVVPLFALANAGVRLNGDLGATIGNRITIGVILGLVVGKQIGITLFAWLATRFGFSALPAGVSWRQIYGAGWLAGIGFTMSLFVADLAFQQPGEDELLTSAKLGILAASLVAGVAGWLILSRWSLAEKAQR
jgi:NhaA family Na+:H+ antiporter